MTALRLRFVKVPGALRPADTQAEEALNKLAKGDVVWVEFWQPHNPRFHNKYWKMLQLVAENTDEFTSAQHLHLWLKERMHRYVDYVDKITGQVIRDWESTSFYNMKEPAFSKYYDDVVRIICTEVIPGLDNEALEAEVIDLIDGEAGRRAAER